MSCERERRSGWISAWRARSEPQRAGPGVDCPSRPARADSRDVHTIERGREEKKGGRGRHSCRSSDGELGGGSVERSGLGGVVDDGRVGRCELGELASSEP